MRAVIISVDYWDIASVTLPRNRKHFDDVLVITTPADVRMQTLARQQHCQLHITDVFTAQGASFNKFAALEEGLSAFGRHGWLCHLDADILWPQTLPDFTLEKGYLYGPLRRMAPWPGTVPREIEWPTLPLHPNVAEIAGFSQIYHAEDPVLGPPPWHAVDFTHAGTADSLFQFKWPAQRKVRLPFEVLHLGEAGKNWMGRVTAYANGTVPEQAAQRTEAVRRIWQGRRGKTGLARFDHERLPPTELIP